MNRQLHGMWIFANSKLQLTAKNVSTHPPCNVGSHNHYPGNSKGMPKATNVFNYLSYLPFQVTPQKESAVGLFP